MRFLTVFLKDGDTTRRMDVNSEYRVGDLLTQTDFELLRSGEILVVQGAAICMSESHLSDNGTFEILRDPDAIKARVQGMFKVPSCSS